jgi:hypothetical protein
VIAAKNWLLPAGFSIEMAAVLSHVALQHGWSVLSGYFERNANMHEPDFWTSYAESVEMSIEGNRLIAHEVAEMARDLWHRAVRSFHGSARHQHLPPL